jgi:DNA gyrase/topoisomerase IV subunit A
MKDDDDAGLRAAQRVQRLHILDALVSAIDQRDQVHVAICSSPSAEHAVPRLMTLLGISELGAVAILDLQWRRLAELERGRIIAERDEIRATLI